MKVFKSKFDWIGRFIDGSKSVLDVGCVCHDLTQTAVPWLHGFLCRRAKSVTGVDVLEKEVAQMQTDGYDAVCADACTMNLSEQFDVIVGGDILEHLDNFSNFFQCAKEHLNEDGTLLITTPNPITYLRFLRVILKGSAGANKQHTCWFTLKVLKQLGERNGLELVEAAFVNDSSLFYPWLKPIGGGSALRRGFRYVNRLVAMALIWKPACVVQSLLCRIRPELAETLCVALKKRSG